MSIRVAIVDDHPMFRMGLAAAIREMQDVELVGEASRADVEDAFYEKGSLVQRLAPAEATTEGGEPAPPSRRSRYRWTVSTP